MVSRAAAGKLPIPDVSVAEGAAARRYLPWIVATALFMEQLDSTIVNTAVPAIAASLEVSALDLKGVVASYVLTLAVGIPLSGWMADRFGTRRVFTTALQLFTLASALCAVATSVPTLVAARCLQGLGAAMMVPVGRLMVVRSYAKAELLQAMNIVIIPALAGPLLGPTVGGLIVHWTSWRMIFLVNVPVALLALSLVRRYLPDYRAAVSPPLDVLGLATFALGTTLLSWRIGVFGDHPAGAASVAALPLAVALLVTYGIHARRTPHPLLSLALFRVRTFRVAVAGGFATRLGLGAMPFLLPLLFQLGLGRPAWESGLLLVPMAAGAMAMKWQSARILARLGYRTVLVGNTLLLGLFIGLFALIDPATPTWQVVLASLALGLCNSLQFASMNSVTYADVDAPQASTASTIASTAQQMSMSYGLALGAFLATAFLAGSSQDDPAAVRAALRQVFVAMGAWTALSSVSFMTLRPGDGAAVIGSGRAA